MKDKLTLSVESYFIETDDGWSLQTFHYRPSHVSLPQPVICVHGFSQSHLAWTVGGFAQTLAMEGMEVYVFNFRGHGDSRKSDPVGASQENEEWTIDDYARYDLEAVVESVRERHNGERVILCGHSLGGVLSAMMGAHWGREQVAALMLLAAPLDPSKSARRVHLACELILRSYRLSQRFGLRWSKLPMSHFLSLMDGLFFSTKPGLSMALPVLSKYDRHQIVPRLWHPENTKTDVVRKILQNGESETMPVVLELSRWFLEGEVELKVPRLLKGKETFSRLDIPVFGAWAEEDLLAPPETSSEFWGLIKSEYSASRIIPRSNHIDMTAGRLALDLIPQFVSFLRGAL